MSEKRRVIRYEEILDVENLLSSNTYETEYYNKCIYCDAEVENEYYEYDGEWYQPHRCNCDGAKKELDIKENILRASLKLNDLNEYIDVDRYLKNKYEAEMNILNNKFEDLKLKIHEKK